MSEYSEVNTTTTKITAAILTNDRLLKDLLTPLSRAMISKIEKNIDRKMSTGIFSESDFISSELLEDTVRLVLPDNIEKIKALIVNGKKTKRLFSLLSERQLEDAKNKVASFALESQLDENSEIPLNQRSLINISYSYSKGGKVEVWDGKGKIPEEIAEHITSGKHIEDLVTK
ncbi:hypothetical protein [Vibrio alginolyticus]|uniref:hypothetical protein n=1 Tax=Vibrio alginolyticus TaxID=663 RepID=UPI0006CA77B9|nr:hypothetical protein [Vibrio alginolyticus]KPM98646.1 hypothetical protein AOG25_09515 [Vibrio alginolyticus]CAH7164715.1 conserved hypothetical protein [Vibrio chagasii]CAH7334410.1 conserved hypothetical protein [Vibrio chagasii]